MHELSIAQALADTIGCWQENHGNSRVLSACVEVGPLGGVDAESLRCAWLAAREFACGGTLKECTLNIVELPFRYLCGNCGKNVTEKKLISLCPCCGAETLHREGGRELNLKNIEVEDHV